MTGLFCHKQSIARDKLLDEGFIQEKEEGK
jgi:hypothetical protein